MGLLNWLRGGAPKGYKALNVTFTPEESAAMERALSMFGRIAAAEAPEGMQVFFHPKVIETMKARGLSEYAEELVHRLDTEELTDEEINVIGDKAVKATLKAYGLHNLPIYMLDAANIFERLGRMHDARTWWKMFIKDQERFVPDDADKSMMRTYGLDASGEVDSARKRLA